MAAAAVAIGAGGALSSFETTVLLTVEDTLAALDKASSVKVQGARQLTHAGGGSRRRP